MNSIQFFDWGNETSNGISMVSASVILTENENIANEINSIIVENSKNYIGSYIRENNTFIEKKTSVPVTITEKFTKLENDENRRKQLSEQYNVKIKKKPYFLIYPLLRTFNYGQLFYKENYQLLGFGYMSYEDSKKLPIIKSYKSKFYYIRGVKKNDVVFTINIYNNGLYVTADNFYVNESLTNTIAFNIVI